jgi:hypothetical protein
MTRVSWIPFFEAKQLTPPSRYRARADKVIEYVRVTKVIKSDGTTWEHEALHKEINRQLDGAADGVCPECAARQH